MEGKSSITDLFSATVYVDFIQLATAAAAAENKEAHPS